MPGREVPETSDSEKQWGLRLSEAEDFWSPKHSSSRAHTQTFLDSLPLSSSTGAAAQKAKEISRGELNYLASGRELGAGAVFCQTEVLAEAIAPFLRP